MACPGKERGINGRRWIKVRVYSNNDTATDDVNVNRLHV